MGVRTSDPEFSQRVPKPVLILRSYGEVDVFTNVGSSETEAASRGARTTPVNVPVL